MHVLFVTSEAYPVVKTGGLADVSGALPAALRQLGVDVRLLLPGYTCVLDAISTHDTGVVLPLLPDVEAAHVRLGKMPDGETPVYVLDCPSLYRRSGDPYHDEQGLEWPDNHLRFAALSKAAALLASPNIALKLKFQPELIHCNDWQTALTPAYQHYMSSVQRPVLLSIHNMAYQGVFAPKSLPALGLPWESFSVQGLEFYGSVSFLKAGLFYADWLNTVSSTYAQEIQTKDFGYGLQGLLQHRQDHLSGLLNGIDIQQWNPATDKCLFANYDAEDLSGKAENKQALQQQLGLAVEPDAPLLGCITRLTEQKGIDWVVQVLPDILAEGAQFVILGSGDSKLEQALTRLAHAYPQQISVTLGYHETLSHRIEAAADIFLMPSRFEPCGLNQMYSMRYGTLPIVRRTGGLADTVIPVTPAHIDQHTATGFVFESPNAEALLQTVQYALVVYRHKALWRMLQRNAMQRDFSWQHSAQAYFKLYQQLSA